MAGSFWSARRVALAKHGRTAWSSSPGTTCGRGPTNPAEFFAVATECFFEKPAQLRQKHPELYEELKEYYRQDPERAVTRGGGASSAGTV